MLKDKAPLIVLVGVTLALSVSAEQSRRSASDFTFDGLRLGANFQAEAMSKAAFQSPCDEDPIEGRSRRIVVYMSSECRGRTFPEDTTVLFYLAYSETDPLAQPIEAIAWIGGGYFNSRSDFPARPGQTPAEVASALGPSTSSFQLGENGRFITVREHAGDIYSVSHSGRVVAFVAGRMPDDRSAESWEALFEMAGRTLRPPRRQGR